MSKASQNSDLRHIHSQIKAVYTLIQPEYKSGFKRMAKFLELQLILQELSEESSSAFQANSVSKEQPVEFDLTDFVRAVAPSCTKEECNFLQQLQRTQQTIHMFQQMQTIQNLSSDASPENLMAEFLTPSQKKAFQQFEAAYSEQTKL